MEREMQDLLDALDNALPEHSVKKDGDIAFSSEKSIAAAKGLAIKISLNGILVARIAVTTAFPGKEGLFHGAIYPFRSLLPKEVRQKFKVDQLRSTAEVDGEMVKCETEDCCMRLPSTENPETIAATIRYILTGKTSGGMSFDKEGA